MNQQVTFEVNTKSLMLMMAAFMATIAATILIALGLVVPSIVKASTTNGSVGATQTANANPVVQVPAGYTLVPVGPGSCVGGVHTSAVEPVSSNVTPLSYKTVVPGMSYNSTITQNHTETYNQTKYIHSFNTKGDMLVNSNVGENINSGNSSNNGNNNNNGNNSNNTANNAYNTATNTDNSQASTVVNTTTTTVNTNSNNEILSNNSLNVGAGAGAGSGGGTE
ncbi:MAG TPA: hypothetical protein PKC05_04500 [Candidatus Saccharibacteria bacterium]|nr:hypothetical protein [Candidatus Saccharibacteria bacterium]